MFNISNITNTTLKSRMTYAYAGPVEVVFLIFLMVCIISGNCLVCLAFSSGDRKFRTVTNYFVINLALSDILVGIFSMSFWLCIRTGTIQFNTASGKAYLSFDILCGSASILNLTIISIERTFAVKSPATHRNLSRNRSIIYGGIAFVWVLSALLAFLFVYILEEFHRSKINVIFLSIIVFFIPTAIIIASYVTIFHAVKTRVFQHNTLSKEVRLAAMIGIVIVLFLLCWFPFFLFNILSKYCACWGRSMVKFIPAVKYLHYCNSTMNPFIYAYRNADYRRALRKIVCRIFRCGGSAPLESRAERGLSFRTTLPSQGNSVCRESDLSQEGEKDPVEGSTSLLGVEAKQIRN